MIEICRYSIFEISNTFVFLIKLFSNIRIVHIAIQYITVDRIKSLSFTANIESRINIKFLNITKINRSKIISFFMKFFIR